MKGYPKGKTYEERYGIEKSKNIKEKLSKASKGRKYSDEIKLKFKEAQNRISAGKTYEERFGTERAKEIKRKISEKTKEKLNIPEIYEKMQISKIGRKMPKGFVEKRLATIKERGGYKHSQETKNKIGKANSISLKGIKQPKEVIEKRRLKLIGIKKKPHTKITKDKIRNTILKKIENGEWIDRSKVIVDYVKKTGGYNKGRTDLKCSEEARIKLKEIWNRPEYKKMARERRAKQVLPIKDTSIEIKIQNFLKQLGIDFFTHQYMKIEHGYQCDILIPSMNLVIECDGDYWHKYPTGNDIDHIRTKELLNKGFKVLRLWEFEIKEMNIDKFKEKIK